MVTAEVAPPLSTATNKLCQNIELVRPYVAAVNFTDNPSATARMSSLACSIMALQHGAEPVMQLQGRDRTRGHHSVGSARRERAGRAQHSGALRR